MMESFPTTIEGLTEATRPIVVDLQDGDAFDLEIAPVRKTIGDATVRMLAYGGSVPGPTLRVPEGSTVTVRATNHGDLDATVHWHGLRLENRYDGKIATFSPSETTYVAMGRFGNIMLVSGEADLSLTASRGEVVRFFLTNTANTRVFNVTLPGARMKLVGADSGP